MDWIQEITVNIVLLIGCVLMLIQLMRPSKESRNQASDEKNLNKKINSGYKKCMDSVKNMKDEDIKSRI